MPVIQGLQWTFDTVAADYALLRPGYVPELYDRLLAYQPLSEQSYALEIGIGGGQATLPVLETGCRLTAVEIGAELSALCQQKFAAWPGFSVVNAAFEAAELPEEQFDLVYSASAFHWIPEDVGYPKVLRLLKPGGTFARFANHPFRGKDAPELNAAIDALYETYYAPYHGTSGKPAREYTQAQAQQRADVAARYGFTDIACALFYRTRTFTAATYLALLGTYSDHIALPEAVRAEFFQRIAEVIEAHGGEIHIHDTLDLQLARKP